jgi:hypothetical protein
MKLMKMINRYFIRKNIKKAQRNIQFADEFSKRSEEKRRIQLRTGRNRGDIKRENEENV